MVSRILSMWDNLAIEAFCSIISSDEDELDIDIVLTDCDKDKDEDEDELKFEINKTFIL